MASRYWPHAILVGASFLFPFAAALASPQVVGDGACDYYAVDIASFATCENGRVVLPHERDASSALPAAAEPGKTAVAFGAAGRHRGGFVLAMLAFAQQRQVAGAPGTGDACASRADSAGW